MCSYILMGSVFQKIFLRQRKIYVLCTLWEKNSSRVVKHILNVFLLKLKLCEASLIMNLAQVCPIFRFRDAEIVGGTFLHVAIANKNMVPSCGQWVPWNSTSKPFSRELVTIFLTLQPQSTLTQSLIFPEIRWLYHIFLLKALLHLIFPRANMKVQTENASLHFHSHWTA